MNLFASVAVAMMLSLIPVPGHSAEAAPASAKGKPNVVLILTDDMRLDDMRYMPFTRRLFARTGTTFTRALSPHPLCCPARAELFTGQYAQNNGVRHNGGPNGGWKMLRGKDDLIFRWFRRDGYKTSYIGKLMNGYKGGHIAGLSDNDIAVRGTYRPDGMTSYNDGNPRVRNSHQTTYLTRRTKSLIRSYGEDPFLIWAGVVSPHRMRVNGKWGPPVPPPGYDHFRKPGHRRPQSFGKPSYNHNTRAGRAPVSKREVRRLHRGRVLSLYAVDDSMRKIVRTLKREGVYRDTVLVFASDNGMGLGTHRYRDKNQPYQDIMRVPLMLAGPGVPSGVRNPSPVTLVDLPGTVARLAGVSVSRASDGGDLFSQPRDRAVLIQAGSNTQPWEWRGVYTRRYTYVERSNGRVEFYDRATDPHELSPGGEVSQRMKVLLRDLEGCEGDTCQRTY